MSQLKKQTIVGRKPGRRHTQSSASPHPARKGKTLLRGVQSIGRLLRWICRPVGIVFKRWPKAALAASLSVIVVSGTAVLTHRFIRSLTDSLPEQVQVISPRAELQNIVSNLAKDTLVIARRDSWNRSAFVDKLLSRISSVDGVDEVSIRSGLDNKLTINLIAQVPLLVMEGKEGERILIGSKFKIIARGLNQGDYSHLPQIEAPDLSLNIRLNREKKKSHSGLFIRPTNTSSANIRWLSQQALKLYSHFEAEKIPVEILKIIWRNGTGFSATVLQKDTFIQDNASHSPVPTNSPLVAVPANHTSHVNQFDIIFGESQFQEKFIRLQQIIQDLRLKNSLVDHIDLAFSDKAIIKVKDQMSEVKRGGIQ